MRRSGAITASHSGNRGNPAVLPAPPNPPGSFSETEGNLTCASPRGVCRNFHLHIRLAVKLCHLLWGSMASGRLRPSYQLCGSPEDLGGGNVTPHPHPLPWGGRGWRLLEAGPSDMCAPAFAGREVSNCSLPAQPQLRKLLFSLRGLHMPFYFTGLSPSS